MMHISMNLRVIWRAKWEISGTVCIVIWKLGVGACKRGIRQGVQRLVRIMLICYLIHVRRNLDLYYHFVICSYLNQGTIYDLIIWFMWFHISWLLNSQTAPCFPLKFLPLTHGEKIHKVQIGLLSLLWSHRSAVLLCRAPLWTIACGRAFMD
jgi:hypothetical protein